MNNLKMYCLTMNPMHLNLIKKIGYIPVGLGSKNFSNDFLTDKSKINIAQKNSSYGEYTFHYWLWQNQKLTDLNTWIGFCQYRKFWSENLSIQKDNSISNFDSFNNSLLKKITYEFEKYDSILGEELYVNEFKFSKFLKKNFLNMIRKPELFYNKKKRTIKFHFDLMHGSGNLEKAIELLNQDDRSDFKYFVNTEVSFNPHNMFICKSSKILLKYYESVFSWLKKCEEIFGFKETNVYGLKRIYGFLAERYLSYWFKKYTKYTVLPIIFKDIGDFNYKAL